MGLQLCKKSALVAFITLIFSAQLTARGTASASTFIGVKVGQVCKQESAVRETPKGSLVCTRKGKKLTWQVLNLGKQVENLSAFISRHGQSVVTISCNGSQGSGVSIAFSPSPDSVSKGFRSYIVTNQHVIFGCLTIENLDKDVLVTVLHQGVEYVGYAIAFPSWNQVQRGEKPDLAGVMTTALIPQASLYGVKQPLLGQAVVAVGSAGGVPNVTTRGEIAGLTTARIITTAPAGHGSSGGALFNNIGQLLGFITAANASLVEVTPIPQICNAVLNCSNQINYVP
jgi:S1-C subfamily serine protease